MKIASLILSFVAGLATLNGPVRANTPHANATSANAPRTVLFQITTECNCASCVFDVQRSIKKFEGVKSAKFNGRDHRLEISFVEGTHPLSELAQAVEKSDLGKGSALCLLVPRGGAAKAQAQALGQVPGVKSARLDAKSGALLLNFQGAPAVSLKQLDAAQSTPQGATQVATQGATP